MSSTDTQPRADVEGAASRSAYRATWIIVTINAWNRLAIAAHMQAGDHEPDA